MLIDDVKITIQAGHGGKGAVAFNKTLMSLGPAGGAGGRGGSVYVEGMSDLSILHHYRNKKDYAAENGHEGKGQFVDGRAGEDLTLPVPVGTIIHNLDTGADVDITHVGEKVLVAAGGFGGKGNYHFRSSTNTSPKQFQPGLPGEGFTLRLELKLIADVGLIGLPNVGKSSLLNALTKSQAKVANYEFTTLEPNLGAYYGGIILADIPGLIEGASQGKGLGHKFLRHIERTRVLFHLVSATSVDPLTDYQTVREELRLHNPELIEKKEYVFLSRSDDADKTKIAEAVKALKKANPVKSLRSHGAGVKAEPISILDDTLLKPVKKALEEVTKERESTN